MNWNILAENGKFIIFQKYQVCQLQRKNKQDRVLFSLEDYSAIDGVGFDTDDLELLKSLFSSIGSENGNPNKTN